MTPMISSSLGSARARKWTVMVFMGTETEEGNAPLVEAAISDLEEMMAVGSCDSLNIFVQVHAYGVPPVRYHLGVSEEIVPESQRETAEGWALAQFIESSLMKRGYEHAEADNSLLVLWGHAYDFAIGHAPTRRGTIDALDFVELSAVLRRLQNRMREVYHGQHPPTLDVVGFDACDVSTVEMACQLAPFAKYLLGSEVGVPIPGWPYDRVLERLRFPAGRLMGPAEFGTYAVRRYCESYVPSERSVSLTLLDLKRTPELFALTEVLATTLNLAISRGPDTRDLIAQIFRRSQTKPYKAYVDVADLCLNLMRESGDSLVIEAARAVGDFLIAAPREVVDKSLLGEGRPFVVEHGRNGVDTAKLNGISLYAPHVALTSEFEAVRKLYEEFRFTQETSWSRLVYSLAEAQLLST